MVAREGAAPPISGCRPDVILFHHRAFEMGLRPGIWEFSSVFGSISAFTPGSWESLRVNFCVKRFDDALE